jgi:hypothetical protein
MRDIRSRISKRHGIDLTPQQIHELAARRLEAILEPRHVAPSLLEQMRRAAGQPIEVPSAAPDASNEFDVSVLYESHRGFLRTLRRWLNPILRLFINPKPLADALRDQVRRSNAAAAREAEFYNRQAEWNALHFEIVQRLVTEVSRATLEMQSLTLRVESLAAKVDFNERRVRGLEGASYATRPGPKPVEPGEPVRTPAHAPEGGTPSSSDPSADGSRRRRRRRRGGRRPGPPGGEGPRPLHGMVSAAPSPGDPAVDVDLEPDPDEPESEVVEDTVEESLRSSETTVASVESPMPSPTATRDAIGAEEPAALPPAEDIDPESKQ